MGKVGGSEGSRAVPSLSSREFYVPESASYVATVVDITSEPMVRTCGGSPAPSFLQCSLYSNSTNCIKGHTSIFPRRENAKRLPAATVRCSPRYPNAGDYAPNPESASTSDLISKSLRRALPRHGRPRLPCEVDRRGSKRVGSR